MTYRLVSLLMFPIVLSACASSEPARPDRPDRQGQMLPSHIASPMALALAGMASDARGVIDLADIPAATGAMFDAFDTDASGTWSRGEHADWADAILGDRYANPTWLTWDRDDSGTVSRAEFELTVIEVAARFDRNGDGQIERSELLRAVPTGRAEGRRSGRNNPQQEGGRQQGGRGPR